MDQATWTPDARPARLGEGEFPPELDRVNFGAFLLAFIWAPFHHLWGWFGVFALLEAAEAVMGLSAPHFLGGVLELPVTMVAFRVVYWGVTVAFAVRANRLVWEVERRRAARVVNGEWAPRPPAHVSSYASNLRVWAVVGLVLLIASPVSLLIPSVGNVPGAAVDVAVTTGTQAVLLAALFAYDRVRLARRRARATSGAGTAS